MNNDAELLDNFETRTGIQLPAAVRKFLLAPWELEEFWVPSVKEITSLEVNSSFYDLPLRTIPFLVESDGSTIALHYPRRSEQVLIVGYSPGSNGVEPLTDNVDLFFQKPDSYSLYRRREANLQPPQPLPWLHYLHKTSNEPPELELLKPLALNITDNDDVDLGTVAALIEASRRIGQTENRPGYIEAAGIVAKSLETPEQVLTSIWWQELARNLADDGHYSEAIQALDNCSIICRVRPYYGHTYENCPATLPQVRTVFEQLEALASAHGDGFDQLLVARLLADIDTQMQREEAEHQRAGRSYDPHQEISTTYRFEQTQQIEINIHDRLMELKRGADKRTGKLPIDNNQPEVEFAVNLNVCLADVLALGRDAAATEIKGKSDRKKPVALVPVGNTGNIFDVRVPHTICVRIDFDEPEVPVGLVLFEIAEFMQENWVPYPARHRTNGLQLHELRAKRLLWLGSSTSNNEHTHWHLDVDFPDRSYPYISGESQRRSWNPFKGLLR